MYAWTLFLPAVLCLWVALTGRPWTDPDGETLLLDCSLALVAGGLILQLVPLPGALVDHLSPAARQTWALVFLRLPTWLPLTIDPASGAWATLVGIGTIVVFLSSRRVLAGSAIRTFIRGLTLIGLTVSAIGIAQDATGNGLMYWRKAPLQEGAPPFGPFVDRNSFATWVLLAAPLCAGYLMAHTRAHRRPPPPNARWTSRLRHALDARAILTSASISLMIIALLTTLSRSGITSLAVVVALWSYLQRRRSKMLGHTGSWIVGLCAIVLVLAVARVDPVILGRRFAAARTSAADRLMIWRDTMPIVQDFWLTGTGAGTYETVMLVYQRSSPGVRFNQAHNHYLQLASEGGLLLCLPALLVIVSFGVAAARRVGRDASGMYWIRSGALCGLAGVLAQSVWETGLTVPANAVLAAISAAIVVHSTGSPDRPSY